MHIEHLTLGHINPTDRDSYYEVLKGDRRISRPFRIRLGDSAEIHLVFNPTPNERELVTAGDWALDSITGFGYFRIHNIERTKARSFRGHILTGALEVPGAELADYPETELVINNGVTLISDNLQFASSRGTHNIIEGFIARPE